MSTQHNIDKMESETITIYKEILCEMQDMLDVEKKKYPLSERDRIWEFTLTRLLEQFDYMANVTKNYYR